MADQVMAPLVAPTQRAATRTHHTQQEERTQRTQQQFAAPQTIQLAASLCFVPPHLLPHCFLFPHCG